MRSQEQIEVHRLKMQAYWADPANRERHQKRMAKLPSDVKERCRLAHVGIRPSEELRQQLADSNRRYLDEHPEYRVRQAAGNAERAKARTPTQIVAHSVAMRAYWSKPENVEKVSEKHKECWQNLPQDVRNRCLLNLSSPRPLRSLESRERSRQAALRVSDRLSAAAHNRKTTKHTSETKEKCRQSKFHLFERRPEYLAKLRSPEWQQRLLDIGYKPGALNPHWKGGISSLHERIRRLPQYRDWYRAVFLRDNFTCQRCHKRGGKLCAHHIKFFHVILDQYNITTIEQAIACQELWDITNGKALCSKPCHQQEHKGLIMRQVQNNSEHPISFYGTVLEKGNVVDIPDPKVKEAIAAGLTLLAPTGPEEEEVEDVVRDGEPEVKDQKVLVSEGPSMEVHHSKSRKRAK